MPAETPPAPFEPVYDPNRKGSTALQVAPAVPWNDPAYTNMVTAQNPTALRQAGKVGDDLGVAPEKVAADLPGFTEQRDAQIWQSVLGYAPGLKQFASGSVRDAGAIKDEIVPMGALSKLLGTAPREETLSDKYVKMLKSGTTPAIAPPSEYTRYQLRNPAELARFPADPFGAVEGIWSSGLTAAMRMGMAGAEVLASGWGATDALNKTQTWQKLQEDTSRLEYKQDIPFQPVATINTPGGPININPVQAVYSGAQSVLQLAISRGLGLGAGGTLALLSSTQGADQYAQSRARGETVGESLLAGALSGTVEWATEEAPLEYLFKSGARRASRPSSRA